MKTITDFTFKGKRVLMRANLNVPIDKSGAITDDIRIRKMLPTIKQILQQDCKQLVLMCHFGRPDGKFDPLRKTDVIAVRLMKLLGRTVVKVDDCVDVVIPDEKIVLLENVRFHPEEEANDPEFAKKLAEHGDIYVNEAFGDYRAHASTVGVIKYLPSCIGPLFEKEIKQLDLRNAKRPFVVIMGGSKLSTKFPILNKLIPDVDYLLLGGAMIFTFFKAKGIEIGKSLCEDDQIMTARMLAHNEKLVLPEDIVVASEISADADIKTLAFDKIPPTYIGLDIGEASVEEFKEILKAAKTIFWNGPLGYFEIDQFAKATNEIAQFLSGLDAKTIVGGGDSVAAISKLDLEDKFDHVSTGGGASLKFIDKGTLPVLEALKEKYPD